MLGRIATGDGTAPRATPAPPRTPRTARPRRGQRRAAPAPSTRPIDRRYSPVVQRIAAEHDIDLAAVTGTGRDGRVRKQDVLALVNGNGATRPARRSRRCTSRARTGPTPTCRRVRDADAGPDGHRSSEGLSRMRRTIGAADEAVARHGGDVHDLDRGRHVARRGRPRARSASPRSRSSPARPSQTLREFPALNAWLNGERYSRVDDVNLGIAVSLGEDGLIVPVIHRAQELSVEGLAARIRDLARRARAGELTADDVLGGTFTITRPGQYGSIMATPVINQPQVAILDFEAIVKRPVVLTDADGNDSIAIRPMTILGMSWDHRALDGALAAQFLASLRGRLESVT